MLNDNQNEVSASDIIETAKMAEAQGTSNTEKPKQKRKILKYVFIVYITCHILLLIYVMVAMISFVFVITNPTRSANEHQKYLEDKYGQSEGFYYIRNDECHHVDCALFFSSDKISGREFKVQFDSEKKTFVDNYQFVKEEQPKLEIYYRNIFESFLPYQYEISVSEPNTTTTLYSDETYKGFYNVTVRINYNDILDINTLDINALKSTFSSTISSELENKIYKIDFGVRLSDDSQACPSGLSRHWEEKTVCYFERSRKMS